MKPGSISSLSVAGMQGLNATLYRKKNAEISPGDQIAVIGKHIQNAGKLIRQNRFHLEYLKDEDSIDRQQLSWNLAMGVSWLFGLANSFHFSMEDELWAWFPGQCAYCALAPCNCHNIPKSDRPKTKRPSNRIRPTTFNDFQKMFWTIYPNDSVNAANHLYEEIFEVFMEYRICLHSSNRISRDPSEPPPLIVSSKLTEEVADTMTCFFAVASSVDLNLAEHLQLWFPEGCCPGCHETPCGCTFESTVKQVDVKLVQV